jgi:N-methylhydantoinase A
MANEGLAVLEQAGVPSDAEGVTVTHAMDLRHKGQGHEVTVALPPEIFASGSLDAIADVFYAAHREKYGHAHTNLAVELITCRTTVAARPPGVPIRKLEITEADPNVAKKGERPVFFAETGGTVSTPVFDRYRLGPGMEFRGPAIIEERESTVVCGPSGKVHLDQFGTLFIDLVHAPTEA